MKNANKNFRNDFDKIMTIAVAIGVILLLVTAALGIATGDFYCLILAVSFGLVLSGWVYLVYLPGRADSVLARVCILAGMAGIMTMSTYGLPGIENRGATMGVVLLVAGSICILCKKLIAEWRARKAKEILGEEVYKTEKMLQEMRMSLYGSAYRPTYYEGIESTQGINATPAKNLNGKSKGATDSRVVDSGEIQNGASGMHYAGTNVPHDSGKRYGY